ncbi:Ammonia transport outward protein 2 [Wickerhamiella sorbophila]|uniref:Ammonia transport outward protein 2 n=1 Tax=Wickerhamiella sorbophila TaxID=45607 RepID=A0A2T0FNK8_9ASCO|nr:Ammonia transport outward protein 2 [Wickerhamiella sorbophila]PRT56568.1 Ammonia transport outward protein 2 [Wickerhamiella sorbophila]
MYETEFSPVLSPALSQKIIPSDQQVEDAGSDDSNGYAFVGGHRVPLSDVLLAHAGYLNAGTTIPHGYEFGNPAVFGLFSFGISAMLLALYNVHSRGVTIPNVMIGPAFFISGIGQTISGLWEIAVGNTFAATAMTGFGGFWLAYGAVLTPSFGIAAAYADEPLMFQKAMGFLMLSYTIFTAGLLSLVLKSTAVFVFLFSVLFLTFLTESIGLFINNENVLLASAGFNIALALSAFYCGWAGLASGENSYLTGAPFRVLMPGARVEHAPPA